MHTGVVTEDTGCTTHTLPLGSWLLGLTMTSLPPNTATDRQAAVERVRLRFPGPYYVHIEYNTGVEDYWTTDSLEAVFMAYVDLVRRYEQGLFSSFRIYNINDSTMAYFTQEDEAEKVLNEAVATAALLQQKVRYQ